MSRSTSLKNVNTAQNFILEESRSYIINLHRQPNIDTVKMYGWFGIAPNERKDVDATDADPALPSHSATAWPASCSWLQPTNNLHSSEPAALACELSVRTPVENANMKVLHLAIVKNVTRPAVDLAVESDLSSYSRFMRGR